jgi:hypothetical protein
MGVGNFLKRISIILSISLLAECAGGNFIALSQTTYHYFRTVDYGSDAMFNPISVLMNGGLDVLQSYSSSTRASEIPWDIGGTSVWRSVSSPAYWINRYGWNKFLSQEVFPTSLNIKKAQWAPNYFLHIVGGGMVYRKLSEWYDYYGFPLPYVLGAITSMGYHSFNEIVENGPTLHPNTDCIADLCIFDPLGIILFSFDGISEYFSVEFGLNDWSPQPALSFGPIAFRNFGHCFVMRYPLTATKHTSVFLHLGKSTLLGASLKINGGGAVSFGAGATQTGVWEVDAANGIPTNSIRVGATAGFFFDRNNSLLVSLLISEYYLEKIRLNIYPGAASSFFAPFGFFLTLGDRGTYAIGITMRGSPAGVGLYAPQ